MKFYVKKHSLKGEPEKSEQTMKRTIALMEKRGIIGALNLAQELTMIFFSEEDIKEETKRGAKKECVISQLAENKDFLHEFIDAVLDDVFDEIENKGE